MTKFSKLISAIEAENAEFAGFAEGFGSKWFHEAGIAFRAYNGSLDSAKAVHKLLVPELKWIITDSVIRKHDAEVGNHDKWHSGSTTDPARSWLLAVLKAFEASQCVSV